MPAARLLLASESPRRRYLLRLLGIRFQTRRSGVPELRQPGETPRQLVLRLARTKTAAVALRRPRAWVLGADTVVAVGARILGIPRHRREAASMLRLLSGRTHRVWSGVALMAPEGRGSWRLAACTRVTVAPLSEVDIERYLASREWRGKAGGYAIQGRFSAYVRRLDGAYTNVVGLPLEPLRRLLRKVGLLPTDGGRRPQALSARQRSRGRRAAATSSSRRTGVRWGADLRS